MIIKRDPSKLLQIGFVGLLIVSLAQASYWIYDHVAHTRDVQRRIHSLYMADADMLTALYAGAALEDVVALLPHIEIDRAERRAYVRPAALEALDREAAMRINRFLWEGGFFVAVLLGGLTVLTRTIRHDTELRLRQQNFLAAVSHEFKSPLASIQLAAETLLLRSTDAESQRLGRRILEDDGRLLRMVENLLDTTRLEEGRQSLEPERTSLAAVGARCLDAVAERARLSQITLTPRLEEDVTVSVDRHALESMLGNLLDNAINACVAGRGTEIEVSARREDDDVVLSVSDDGVGFPPEDAEMIFEKFFRAGDEMRRATPGSGLGLYIVQRLAKLSGATVQAASEGPGRGARFTLRWKRGNRA